MRRTALIVALLLGAGLASAWPAGGARPATQPGRGAYPTRYSLVHGCYRLRLAGGRQLGPFRMQAAGLGVYLLYGRAKNFLGQALRPLAAPDRTTLWRVSPGAHRITDAGTGRRVSLTFVPATGCAVYPEAQVGATGFPAPGATPAGGVLGTAEGHAHITAFELFGGNWHCGQPFSPFGAPYALPASCAADEQGSNGSWETILDFGGATRPSDMHGWPTFKHWPSPTAVAEEGDYWTGLERAWLAGLRLVVSNNVDNEPLCRLMTTRSHACNDMVSVGLQAHDLYALQDYIDAQFGGPGKGFFRIVRDPFQARQVINQGKMAVVMGIEVSRIFGCGESGGKPQCNQAQVDQGLANVRRLGVRTFFPVHEFNNAFGGSKGISGDTGIIINAGNREETGSFFTLKPCPAANQDAQQVVLDPTGAYAQLLNGPFAGLLGGNPAPVYGPGPQCNVQGLTALGAYLINKMIRQHLIVQLDHMDSRTASDALAIAEQHHYAGVVSAHCCNSPQLFDRLYRTGGAVDAPKDQPPAFISLWHSDAAKRSSKFMFGFGFGSDMNGLSQQTGPYPLTYPFKSFDGRVTFTREVWGQRVFDLGQDGVANYGMFADWLQAARKAGGKPFTADMFNGAEQYLEMWERAYAVPTQHCLTPAAARAIRLGEPFRSVLYGAGQPLSRPGSSYRYCLAGGRQLTVWFNAAGRVGRVVGVS